MRSIGKVGGLLILVVITPVFGWAAEQRDPVYMGKPLSYWTESIRNRDAEMELAFEAIRTLGPDAKSAVPDLTRIVSEPFTAIQVGIDNPDLIASAASSSVPLIQWALTVRVIPMNVVTREDEELFIDLVALDVLERMRVAGAVAMFGRSALAPIAMSLAPHNEEERKLAVAILSEHGPPLAATLLKSRDCEARKLGLAILIDMWPVVSASHLTGLMNALVCDANQAVK
jgi:hypothetical protein